MCHDREKTHKVILGGRLGELRKEKGVSRAKCAEDLDVSEASLGKWERGTILPTSEYLLRLARYYGVSTDYLLGNTEYKFILTSDSSQDQELRVIPYKSNVIPLKEEIKVALELLDIITSQKVNTWAKVLAKINNGQRLRHDRISAMNLIQHAIGAEWVSFGKLQRDEELEKKLCVKYATLNEARVIRIPPFLANFPEFAMLFVAHMAAIFFCEYVNAGDSVAFSGGSTILAMARDIPNTHIPPPTKINLYPLDINPFVQQIDISSTSIIARLSTSLDGNSYSFNSFQTKNDKNIFIPMELSSEAYQVYLSTINCRKAFLGVGNPLNIVGHRLGGQTAGAQVDYKLMDKYEVAADILFRLVNKEGQEIDIPYNNSLPAIPLSALHTMARKGFVVGVAHEDSKDKALHSALKGEYFSVIVITDALAKKIAAL